MPAEPRRRRFALTVAVCLLLGALGGLLAATLRSPDTGLATTFRPRPEPPPDFRLRDQAGRAVSPADARGEVVLLTFFFATCRTSCPQQGITMSSALEEVGPGVRTIIVSVDPVGDTPDQVRGFLRRVGLEDAQYLTGSRRELAPVWARYGIVPVAAPPEAAKRSAEGFEPGQVVPGDAEEATRRGPPAFPPVPGGPEFQTPPPAARDPYPAAGDERYRGRRRHGFIDFEHSAYMLLIDKRGRQRVGFPFESLDDELLVRDLRTLLREN